MVVFHLLAHKHIKNHKPLTVQSSGLELDMLPPTGRISVVIVRKSKNLLRIFVIQERWSAETQMKGLKVLHSLWRLAMHLPKRSVKLVLTAFSTVPSESRCMFQGMFEYVWNLQLILTAKSKFI